MRTVQKSVDDLPLRGYRPTAEELRKLVRGPDDEVVFGTRYTSVASGKAVACEITITRGQFMDGWRSVLAGKELVANLMVAAEWLSALIAAGIDKAPAPHSKTKEILAKFTTLDDERVRACARQIIHAIDSWVVRSHSRAIYCESGAAKAFERCFDLPDVGNSSPPVERTWH